MPPALISTGVFILQQAIKYAPGLVKDLRELFTKDNPTEADWKALHDKINSKTYYDYVPGTALPRT